METYAICQMCGEAPAEEHAAQPDVVCASCAKRIPPSLLKAAIDTFDYALRLRTGELIRFGSATLRGDYVSLSAAGALATKDDEFNGLAFPFPRGLDVRLADIVWCADAPQGS